MGLGGAYSIQGDEDSLESFEELQDDLEQEYGESGEPTITDRASNVFVGPFLEMMTFSMGIGYRWPIPSVMLFVGWFLLDWYRLIQSIRGEKYD